MFRFGLVVGALAVALSANVGLAHAQGAEEAGPSAAHDAEARALFEAGRVAFADGRFEDALEYFRRSHELSQRPALLYNIGSAADRLQLEAEALAAFEQYLASVPDAPNRREVEGRIRVLREHAAREAERAEQSAVMAREESSGAASAEAAADNGAAAEAAAAAGVAEVRVAPEREDSGGDIGAELWWLWTILGVVVVGGVVTAGVLIANDNPSVSYPPYETGDDDAVHFTLSVPLQ